jgi:ABC-2 type transport system ATP-binding protein
MSAVVTVEALRKKFGEEVAVQEVSFEVDRGRLFGLVGADGAGKSTLMRMLTTLIPPDGGEAFVLGRSIRIDLRFIRSHIGFMPQHFSLYGDMSVAENLHFFADIFGVAGAGRRERINRLLDFSRLGPFKRRPAAKLSGGMKQKLALCCALVHSPEVLILDEPTTGVDPVSRREFWKILTDLRDGGITILLATPYMDEANWCDELVFMHRGKLLCRGAPEALIDGYEGAVFRISGADEGGMLHCPATVALPEGIESVYPSGGALRVVSCHHESDADALLHRVKEVIPQAAAIERCRPDMEDLFFHHVATADDPPSGERREQ